MKRLMIFVPAALLLLTTTASAQTVPGVGDIDSLTRDALKSSGEQTRAAGETVKEDTSDLKALHTCSEKKVYKDQTIKVSRREGVAIVAKGNCKLRLENVTIIASVGIVIQGNAEVQLKNVTIKTRHDAIRALGTSDLVIKGSKISSKKGNALHITGTGAVRVLKTKLKTKSKPIVRLVGTGSLDLDTVDMRGKRAVSVVGTAKVSAKKTRMNKAPWIGLRR